MRGVPCERCPGPGGVGLVQLADPCRDRPSAFTEECIAATHWDVWLVLGPRRQSLRTLSLVSLATCANLTGTSSQDRCAACRSLHACMVDSPSCAKQAAATWPGTPEGVLTERAEVVQLYRSPGLSASAAAALLRRVRWHCRRKIMMCLLRQW